uniref:hypothetical protein n=1 Tax=Microzonia abyssicola TaxID=217214 RepID=UPI002E79325E|nr:hypothetical protein V2497_pgp058 [Syringoderma abyssicola]WAM65031.1 hypothetical protein [Syringoderma abyssicola]
MCICLNCYHINNCSIYYTIEEKHEKKIIGQGNFSPQSPIIICITSNSNKNIFLLEWDVNECLSYQENPGGWLSLLSTDKNPKLSSYISYDLLFSEFANLNSSSSLSKGS